MAIALLVQPVFHASGIGEKMYAFNSNRDHFRVKDFKILYSKQSETPDTNNNY